MTRGGGVMRAVLSAVLVSVVLVVTGCGSEAGVGTTAPDTISIKNFMFSPMTLTVSPGAKIAVTNEDSATHTLTATGAKAFDTGDVSPGRTVTFTAPSRPGSYSYICDIHQYMAGTLIVK
ncbi:MAG TPA: cupredoxin domain-containing protein [Pseudonocardiaceae bacterium]